MHSGIQAALRAGISSGARRVGPFLVHMDEHSDNEFRNYAIPDDGAAPSGAEVAGLVGTFRELGRRPRLEYLRPAPAVDAALLAAGFEVELVLPVLALPEGGLAGRETPAALDVSFAAAEEELRAAARVQNVAYGVGDVVSDADVARLRGTVRAGGGVALARWDGVAAGAGLYTAPSGGLAEIAAVAVLPEYRRSGIASVLGIALSAAVQRAGATPFLQTESSNEERLYARIGYTRVGELVAVSLPD